MTFKTFAIAGISGKISKTILQTFLDLPTVPRIYVLTRQDNPDVPSHPNISIVKVDYSSPDTIAASLQGKGIEVLVSTIGGNLLAQEPLVKAAKKAGIKLYVPSEYGSIPKENTPLASKITIRKLAEAEGIPTAIYLNSLFYEYVPLIFGKEKVTVLNGGNGILSVTSFVDVARFVAWSLTTLPEEELYNSTWRLEGDRLSAKQIAELLKNKYGSEIVHVKKEDLPLTQDFPGFINFFHIYIDEGCGTTTFDLGPGDSSDRINAVKAWPEWKPKKFAEYLSSA
ncbi:NAD(P)-binding protein [Atractiella rhizophila]|nr:NAD(P)-binding protein [Atractiella rhizophila]KAH8920372.1 NAD(P)-binding protein [Atractiella rhizophila]